MPEYTLHLEHDELTALVGERAAARLWALPGRYDAAAEGVAAVEVFVRRYSAETRPWIKLHADVAAVTANVALSGDDEAGGVGGRLVCVHGGAARVVARAAGDAVVHSSSLLHGVSRLRAGGQRYSLIVFFHQPAARAAKVSARVTSGGVASARGGGAGV
eukprot:3748278-Prymnesium_polylepis.1